MASVENRLLALEDVDEILRLKSAYCDAADGGWDRRSHNGARVAALFTNDGVWDAGGPGRAEGPAAISALFDSFEALYLASHNVAAPSITVDGDTAMGRWHVITLLAHREQGPLFAGGAYWNEMRRTPAGWRFSLMKCELGFFSPPERGWQDPELQRFIATHGMRPNHA